MRRLRAVPLLRSRVFAALLLAVWLVALQHCGLEAAGVFGVTGASTETSCCDESRCAADACSTIEDAAYVHPDGALAVLAPSDADAIVEALLRPAPVLALGAPVLPRTGGSDSGRHCAHVVGWRFSQRSALLPGAPSSIG